MRKYFAFMLMLVFALALTSCKVKEVSPNETVPTETEKAVSIKDVPEDFSFSLVWDVMGDSSYDSKTGKLVKQKVMYRLDEFTTTYFLTEEETLEVYKLISEIDIESYPDEYDPLNAATSPSRDIILSVTMNGKTKTITCKDIAVTSSTPNGEKGRNFMKVHDTIVKILTGSEEWKALPDYERIYD